MPEVPPRVRYKIGIVGSEGAKFTPETERKARAVIREICKRANLIVSGGCHLGGIDIWAVEEAKKLGIETLEHLPASLSWSGGYKERNLQIVDSSDEVICITVHELPPAYSGMTFEKCYHCNTTDHVKSGGCWTVKQARMAGKRGKVIVVYND